MGKLCKVSVISAIFKNGEYDPNYTEDADVAYKESIKSLIETSGVRFVIDLHGAALHSRTLDRCQTIDLGYRCENADERSMGEERVQALEDYLEAVDCRCDPACYVVGRNKFPAKRSGTITSFVFNDFGKQDRDKVEAIQIELKPQVRVAHRFPTASLYTSCGSYDADPNCIMHTVQALTNFIEHLKSQGGEDAEK